MNRFSPAAILCLSLAASALLPAAADDPKPDKAKIEIAVLLDTSGSMSGLINQARTRLWAIVNQLATAKRDGKDPDLRVALYEYGKDSLPAEGYWIRSIVPLTDDLDKISAELFALTTNGGEEYCGAVIQRAVDEVKWTAGDHYKAIFIAGNEPFSQGPVDYKVSCANAIKAGILVNTLHCGVEAEGMNTGWKHGAQLADGQSLNIDHNAETVAIAAPQDTRIEELGRKLNDTYLAYGALGGEYKARQLQQDANAAASGQSNSCERALSKGCGGQYRNDCWDLVDAFNGKQVDLLALKEEELPEVMRKMTVEERKAYVEKMAAERATIQEEMKKLDTERFAYLAVERKKLAEQGAATFDGAVLRLVNDQLEERGYTVRK